MDDPVVFARVVRKGSSWDSVLADSCLINDLTAFFDKHCKGDPEVLDADYKVVVFRKNHVK